MARTLPMIEARKKLTSLPETFAKEPETTTIAVTRRGKPVLAIMPWEFYESLVETLDILGDEELLASLRQAITEAEAGQGISWEEAKKELGR